MDTQDRPSPLRYVILLLLLATCGISEARTNNYCSYSPHYGGRNIDCGGHLQPACDSGAACDAGHVPWSGQGFPTTVNCPSISYTVGICPFCYTETVDIADVTINSGCYNEVPTCNNCGGNGQPPCPENTPLSCEGCDAGTSYSSQTGLCLAPSTVGAICDISVGCAEGLLCDSQSSQCFSESQAGESCLLLPCADGLQCTLALECSHVPRALEGETCDVTAPCAEGLFCAPGLPQRCQAKARPLEACNALVSNSCVDGSFCLVTDSETYCAIDPFADDFTEEQCTNMYSPSVQARRVGDPLFNDRTMIFGAGTGTTTGEGSSRAQGVIYGQDGEFGCYNAQCEGLDADVSIEAFLSNGTYDDYGSVAGFSDVLVVEGQLPGSVLNVGFATAYSLEGENIGSETISGIGIGLSPLPIAAGAYFCDTTVIDVYGSPSSGGTLPQAPVPSLPGPAQPPLSPFGAMDVSAGLSITGAADQAAMAVGDPMSLALWVRVTQDTGDVVLLDAPGRYRLSLVNDALRVTLGSAQSWGNYYFDTDITSLREQLWTHLALVRQGDLLEVYVNGSREAAFDGVLPPEDALPGQDTWTLGRAFDDAQPMTGTMAGVALWNTALNDAQVRATMRSAEGVADPALVASFGLGDLPGSTVADAGPSGVTLAPIGGGDAPTTRYRTELLGGALHFDGADEAVIVKDQMVLDSLIMTQGFTLEAWVFPTGPGGHPTFGGTIAGKEGEYYMARKANGSLFYAMANTSPGWVSVDTGLNLPEDTWTHVALTYSAGSQLVAVYLNGALSYTNTGSGPLGTFYTDQDQFRIGGRQNDERTNPRMAFEGLIDEVRVWREAQPPENIAALFDVPVNPDAWPQLAAYWRFDEANSAVAMDSSNNGNHAQLGGGSRWRYPQRVDAGVYADYPRSLIQVACGDNDCPLDFDNDGVSDYVDNCLAQTNPDQRDADLDGYGNRCDGDFNNDDIVNTVDLGYLRSVFFTENLVADINGDGVVNVVDLGLLRQMFFAPPGPAAER